MNNTINNNGSFVRASLWPLVATLALSMLLFIITIKILTSTTLFQILSTPLGESIGPWPQGPIDFGGKDVLLNLIPGIILCQEINACESKIQLMVASNKPKSLDPWFITGFTDAEACFSVNFSENKKLKLGWRVQPNFRIELHTKDLDLLKSIQLFFKDIGEFGVNSTRESVFFQVRNLDDLVNIIIPHFDKYPLQSVKSIDYLLWKQCISLMVTKEHLTQAGLAKIVSIKGAINLGLSDKLSNSFPHVKVLTRPEFIVSENIINPYWITGFFEGDGSIFVSINSTTNFVNPVMVIELNKREKPLLEKIQLFFEGIGNIYSNPSNNTVQWKVGKLSNIKKAILHFNSYPLMGFKSYNFIIWTEIIFLIETKAHLTPEGLVRVKSLKDQLNKWN
jgi:hypothetical protein